MKSHRVHNESEVLTKRRKVALPMATHIEYWPLDRLIPYIRNPRTHSETQVAQIAASIVEFGFLNPILVDTSAGIIAGHGRLRAATHNPRFSCNSRSTELQKLSQIWAEFA